MLMDVWVLPLQLIVGVLAFCFAAEGKRLKSVVAAIRASNTGTAAAVRHRIGDSEYFIFKVSPLEKPDSRRFIYCRLLSGEEKDPLGADLIIPHKNKTHRARFFFSA
jgi:hypothetical protein